MLADAAISLPAQPEQVEEHKAKLSLDAVSQPYITAGIGSADGRRNRVPVQRHARHHNLYAQQVPTPMAAAHRICSRTQVPRSSTRIRRSVGTGVSVSSRPYIAGGYATGRTTINGEPAAIEQQVLYRQINQGVGGMLAYPFSQIMRVEFGGGFTRTSFEQQVETTAFSTAHWPDDFGTKERQPISPLL